MKAIVALMVAVSCASAVAETAEERSACMGDAFKICSAAIPDHHEVYLCLQRNKRQLSQDCRVVMNRHPHEQTTTQGPAGERNQNVSSRE